MRQTITAARRDALRREIATFRALQRTYPGSDPIVRHAPQFFAEVREGNATGARRALRRMQRGLDPQRGHAAA